MLAGRSPFDIAGASENPDQNTEDYLFQVILEKTIRIPRSLSVKAANVLKGFLNKNPADRLGCHSTDSFNEITSHQFFKSIDWDMVSIMIITINIYFGSSRLLQRSNPTASTFEIIRKIRKRNNLQNTKTPVIFLIT